MLEGITVLNATEILAYSAWFYTGFTLIVLGVMLLLVCTGLTNYAIPAISAVSMLLIGATLAIVMSQFTTHTNKFIYQVTIGESVNFQEFHSKYMISKTEGTIYTILEK